MNISQIEAKCKALRLDIINMIADAASGHPGGSLSIVEMLACIYYYKMNIDPKSPNLESRDRFVLSKGHAAPAYYAVLGDLGFFEKSEFKAFRQLGSILQGHPDAKKAPGVDASTGSLGQGVSIAVGMAIGAKKKNPNVNVYTILGDGELQEGQVWEAMMAASHYKLDNLTVLIDHNGLQIDGQNEEVMSLGDLREKFTAFGLECIEVDGNNVSQIIEALDVKTTKPKCIIGNTTKGKGVSFMENVANWHGKAPTQAERELAQRELEGMVNV
ncbi:MAG: putative transketolase [Clostridia bacterium]|jgi:transketolase|nr:putative transketolase [Clostridia bacterium]